MTTQFTGKGAIISPCGKFRYALWRVWSPNLKPLMVIGLNPSTADAQKDDPTIRRCVGFASDWGYGGLLMGNLFAFRSTYPHNLLTAPDPVGTETDEWLARMRDVSGMVLAAWGKEGGKFPIRVGAVVEMFPELHHLGFVSNGQPRHPLYVPKARHAESFSRASAS
jgi:hypothetical protein